ncbi:FMN-dependent alpha-hydroxy acid dehydrogenase [Lophiostoma macrostomum CBS 122681]|uniref:FMN-dependent alpha-hydroxy acid dehydrogenase n=1 Tax=Lophiostoma macrostomum CBS 122681 TaxID=1314788 RepID=A0A6A6T3C5_9PLEO|nr:FMN-dependent alpha-hydroxy acid dehydrogenase [Lophiostoma macrostomum CBS 122681]
MRATILSFASVALAARPWMSQPDTGIEGQLGNITGLPDIDSLVGIPDFEWVAQRVLNISSYTYYSNGAAGEWSYRNNLEVFQRYALRPRVVVDTTGIESTLPTKILGYNFSAPFFIAPAARAGFAHPEAEANLVNGAAESNILYVPSQHGTLTMAQIGDVHKNTSQVTFQQSYPPNDNDTEAKELFKQIEDAGNKAIFLTVDSAADGNRHRAARYQVGTLPNYGPNAVPTSYTKMTWEMYRKWQNFTSLPIVPKGIQTVDDARLAVQNGAPAIYLSNHGGRQVDTSRAPLEVAIKIYQEAPEIFKQVEVYADGGVRYGADIVKLLALGVHAVGIARPFMFSNVYGVDGVKRAVEMFKHELAIDASNVGVADVHQISPDIVDWSQPTNYWYS